MNFKEIKNQIKREGRLFDDQLIECAKNNYNKGRLSALKDEEKFLVGIQDKLDDNNEKWKFLEDKISQIQKEIKEIENK